MKTLQLPFLFLAIILLAGCQALENTPEKPSPYNGDAFLYNTDLTIVTSKNLVETFVLWEKNNRALINNKDVKHAADNVRAHAKEWFGSAKRLREAYAIDPSKANKDALQASLDVISQALAESLGYMTKYTTQKKT